MAIMAVVAAMVIPGFVTSIRGNRLRTAVRTVVKIGRYSRSMAVLRQQPITLVFNLDNSTVSVEGGQQGDNISRQLDRVVIEQIHSQEEPECTEGTYTVVYETNGRCKPYSLVISDASGSSVEIEVDALATATTSSGDAYE